MSRILVDTSVWIDHLRGSEPVLARALDAGQALMHPFVLGEIACGRLKDREDTLFVLRRMPTAPRLDDEELVAFIDRHRLMGKGLGFVDVHLLASTLLASDARLWTRDQRLQAAASGLRVSFLEYDA
jgi:predicted nucleic acid-binding protein